MAEQEVYLKEYLLAHQEERKKSKKLNCLVILKKKRHINEDSLFAPINLFHDDYVVLYLMSVTCHHVLSIKQKQIKLMAFQTTDCVPSHFAFVLQHNSMPFVVPLKREDVIENIDISFFAYPIYQNFHFLILEFVH